MNVLLVNRMMGIAWGGGENYDYHLARGLEALGHRVIVVTGIQRGGGQGPDTSPFETIRLRTPYLRDIMYRLAGRVPLLPGLAAETDLELFRSALRGAIDGLLRRFRIDVAQVLALPRVADDLARQGIPVAMRFPGPPAWFHRRILKRFAAKPRTAMFSHGDTVGYFDRRWGLGIAEVPPGVDGRAFPLTSYESRSAARSDWGIDRDAFVISTTGRLVPGKGFETLIDGMARLCARIPHARLLIAGDGPLRRALERRVADQGIQSVVTFLGRLDRHQVGTVLRASDAFALLSEYENYSNSTLEAMSTGLTPVVTRVGGFPLQVRHESNGLLVEPNDAAGFADAMTRLASNRAERLSYGEQARRFAERFCWRESACRVERIYESIVR